MSISWNTSKLIVVLTS